LRPSALTPSAVAFAAASSRSTAGPPQGQRRGAADAARGAGDDRDPIRERLAQIDHR